MSPSTPTDPEEKPEAETKPRRAKKPVAAKAKGDATAAKAAKAEAEPTEAKVEPAKPKAPTKAKAKAAPKDPPIIPAERPSTRRRGARTPGEAPVVRAQARYVRTSARKARMVCDHIRGKSVTEARAILAFAPRAVARDWAKLLDSAVANAEHNHELVGDELRIHEVHADEGPTLKRFRPRAMGRATPIRKRTSHLSIALTPKD